MIANTLTNTNNGVLQNIRSTSSRAKNEFLKTKPNCSKKHNRQRIQANNKRPMWRILRIFVERSDRPPSAPPPRHLHEHLNNKPTKIVLAPDLNKPYLNNRHNNTVTTIYIKYLWDTLSTHKRLHSWFFLEKGVVYRPRVCGMRKGTAAKLFLCSEKQLLQALNPLVPPKSITRTTSTHTLRNP